ncbi:MAG: integrin alpha, partial [Sandaracinaceae bacterium]
SDTDTFANVLVTLDTVGNVDHLIPSAPLAAMRWHWRVRACRGTPAVRDCSDPSPSSYFVVGRTEIDFNPPDGIRDVVVGGPGSVPDGAIELASASQSGVSMTSDTFVPSAGLSTDSTLGWALAAGDFRARGVNQLVVSAVTESTGSSHGGAVVIVDPGASGTSTQQSTLRSPRSLPNQRFGSSIAVPGDLDGDGYDELVVGEPGEPVGGVEGRVYVFFGSGTGLSTTPTITLSPVPPVPSDSGFGAVVARIGDFDNDGYSDFAIGEPDPSGSTGRAFIVFGRPDRTTIASTMEAFTTPTTAASGARFGAAIVGVGDIDRDGTDDVLIGAPGNNDAGSVYVYANANDAMPRAQIDAAGAMMGADFGASLASLGDVDLDGTVDFVIGAPGWAGTGQVFVYLSPSLDSSITSTQTLPGTGNRFGHCIVGRPYDRSGTPLLVTAPGDDGSATNGEVLGYSLSGTPARFGATYSLSITSSGHRIGWSCL